MKNRNKVILIILLLVLALYLLKTDKAREEIKAENPIEEGVKTEVEDQVEDKIYSREDPEYWIEKLENKDHIIMDREEIQEYNSRSLDKVEGLMDIWSHKPSMEKKELISLINSISSLPQDQRYKGDGQIMDKDFYNILRVNLNLDAIQEENPIQYGLTRRRTSIRTFPSHEPSYRKPGDVEFDRFQETAVYPLEPLVVYLESQDGEWYFARIYNYLGWIAKEDLVLGAKDQIQEYINREEFALVIGRQIQIFDDLYDMGVRIPLKEEKDQAYIGLLPERGEDNKLVFVEREIHKSPDLNLGYLPYTGENIIRQAFKFNGEAYGWGGLNNSRDCSAFIQDIYRSFGLKLPRNTQDQGPKSLGQQYDLNHTGSLEEKLEKLREIPPLSVLYMPGHTMLYLGQDEGEDYIIHQFAGYYEEKDGGLEYKPMMQTALTPITIKTSSGKTYLEAIYLAKEFFIE